MTYSKVEEYPAQGTYEVDHLAERDRRDQMSTMNLKQKIAHLIHTLPAVECKSERIAEILNIPVVVAATYMVAILTPVGYQKKYKEQSNAT